MTVNFNRESFELAFDQYCHSIFRKPSFCSQLRPHALISNLGFAMASWMKSDAESLAPILDCRAKLKIFWKYPIKLESLVRKIINSGNENDLISLFVSPIERGHSAFGLCIVESINRPGYLGILRLLADANPALFKAALTKREFGYEASPLSDSTPLAYEIFHKWSDRTKIEKLPVFHMLAASHPEILTQANGEFDHCVAGARGYYGREHKDLFELFIQKQKPQQG